MASGAIYRWELEKRGEEVAIDVTGSLTLDNDNLMIEAVLSGLGLAFVSEWSVSAELASGRLIRVLQDWTPAYPGICLYYPGHRHVPAGLRAFIGVIREVTAARGWQTGK